MIKAGRQLVSIIQKDTPLRLVAAFWLYTAEANDWQLMLASSQVDTEGPRKVYSQILDVLPKESNKVSGLDLLNITVLGLNELLVKALVSVNVSAPTSLSNKRLPHSNLNGVYVEDVYIYFISDPNHN